MRVSFAVDRQRSRGWVILGLSVLLTMTVAGLRAEPPNETPLDRLMDVLPQAAEDYHPQTTIVVQQLVPEVERWAAEFTYYAPDTSHAEILNLARQLIAIQRRVDEEITRISALRLRFLNWSTGSALRSALPSFLACTAALTDLSGRLRYLSVDVLTEVIYDLGNDAAAYEQLIDLFSEQQSAAGARTAITDLLERDELDSLPPVPDRIKGKILQLIRRTRETETLPWLVEWIQRETLTPELILFIADTIRYIGLPQDPRPKRDPMLQKPAITAQRLYEIVAAVEPADLISNDAVRRAELLYWLEQRRNTGVTGNTYRMGKTTIQAGDWLLMKNPSPYNRFTDLQPGLFTHAGIVTTETGSDGRRRFVIVDLPEVGSTIPATTVDTFVKRTLDYVFLRHKDPKVAHKMDRVAHSVIGHESKFDLNFRTSGIEQLKGENLAGKTINGYCAGLLLLCSQETGRPRNEFFPFPEHPAPGETLANLEKLDVSMQRDFISPTGALFSPQMEIVHRSTPMYSPRRQIEQGIYDHFATQMQETQLTPSLNWYQALRLNVAKATRGNRLLTRVLADAAGVNRNINLVAAAKLGAVVQTLDEIATAASSNYWDTRDAFRLDIIDELRDADNGKDQIHDVLDRRRRHADLFILWEAGVITPRQLRIELVDYYIAEGRDHLNDRLFTGNPLKDGNSTFATPQENP
jgi:hypothetical protein